MRTAIGIDPGLTGAVAVLPDGDYGEVYDMPIEAKAKKGNQIDCSTLLQIARNINSRYPSPYIIAVEQVSAMPGQGVSSMFSLGQSFGAARMFAHALQAPARVELVPAAVWKKALRMTGKQKEFALTRARRFFPAAEELLKRKRDVGRADALLIAHYAHDFL